MEYNVPCAVCEVRNRGMSLMIPARTSCPDDSWTREYFGYLMTNDDNGASKRTQFLCVDKEPDKIGTTVNTNGALIFHVRITDKCGDETLPCGEYDPAKELACVVCSK